ncbi:MAG: F0F1 ATP synthase subunit epsilon [Deltaproteobacteria bacterium]|nr:F0F1 ATP synthase subunit epsilon [Deltaproteobacteria bacterium]
MEKLFLELVTPERVLVSREVDMVVAPGTDGEFGILPGHALFLSGIVPGEIRYTSGSETELFAVTTGFAEVSNNKVSVLVDAAERATEIDVERAQRAIQRAQERLAMDRRTKDIDFHRAEAALRRATARLKVAQKVK